MRWWRKLGAPGFVRFAPARGIGQLTPKESEPATGCPILSGGLCKWRFGFGCHCDDGHEVGVDSCGPYDTVLDALTKIVEGHDC